MQGYCVKCRSQREMSNTQSITMKNGRPATQGTCPTCGTKMFRIGKAEAAHICSGLSGPFLHFLAPNRL